MSAKSESELSVGESVPNFQLENYDGQKVALSDLDNYDGVLVVFMCNHCPYVKAQASELRDLNEEFSSIAIVGVNPNADTHPGDSVDKMPEFVRENGLESSHFYYLVDNDQELAKAFDAKCTPDPFLLDWRHRLYYHGRLNDKVGPEDEIEERDMQKAIKRMLKRKEPPQEQKPSQGCSIKWKEQEKPGN